MIFNKKLDEVPSTAVYVGRPSKWGNKFSHKDDTLAEFRVDTREESILAFAHDLAGDPVRLSQVRKELAGKDLVCWCRPKAGFRGRLLCHAQILAAVANDTDWRSCEQPR